MHRRLLKKLRRRGQPCRKRPPSPGDRFQDEARVGQQGTLTRIWAERGTRPRAPRDTRYIWSYIFGAVCPERAEAAALIMPHAGHTGLKRALEIAKTVASGARCPSHSGWRWLARFGRDGGTRPSTLLKLPPYSPELNPMENVWAYLRANKLAISVFDNWSAVDRCCAHGTSLQTTKPQSRQSLRQWAKTAND